MKIFMRRMPGTPEYQAKSDKIHHLLTKYLKGKKLSRREKDELLDVTVKTLNSTMGLLHEMKQKGVSVVPLKQKSTYLRRF